MKTLILFSFLFSSLQSFSDIGPDGETYQTCRTTRYTSTGSDIISVLSCMPTDGPGVFFKEGEKIDPAQREWSQYRDPIESSVTRAAERCDSITAKNAKTGASVNLYVCTIVHPLVDQSSVNPSDQTFFVDAQYTKPISSSLISFKDGTYYINNGVPRVELAGVPESFNCNPANPMTENQCLQCTCYHEARGTSVTEMYYTNRSVHSRVLNNIFPMFRPVVPLHPTTAASKSCQVVYDLNAYSWTLDPDIRNRRIGEGADMGVDLSSFRLCMSQVKDSLEVKDQYFASYYVNEHSFKPINTNEDAPQLPSWYTDCKESNPSAVINQVPSVINSNVMVNLTHTYVSVCEPREKKFLIENGLANGVEGVVN